MVKNGVAHYCNTLLKLQKNKTVKAKLVYIDQQQRQTYAKQIYRILKTVGPLTPTQISNLYESEPGRKKKDKLVIRQEIRNMVQQGILKKLRHGIYSV